MGAPFLAWCFSRDGDAGLTIGRVGFPQAALIVRGQGFKDGGEPVGGCCGLLAVAHQPGAAEGVADDVGRLEISGQQAASR